MRGSRTIRTSKNRTAVLRELAAGWSVHSATRRAGIGYRSYYDWRDDDPTFRAEADAAMEASTDLLEDEARRRALDQSDLLLIFLLRSRRPAIYNRKQTIAVGGDLDKPVLVHQTGNPDEVVHFFMPPNGRDHPEEIEADEPPTIDGEAEPEEDAA
jgi:hypothetical protein